MEQENKKSKKKTSKKKVTKSKETKSAEVQSVDPAKKTVDLIKAKAARQQQAAEIEKAEVIADPLVVRPRKAINVLAIGQWAETVEKYMESKTKADNSQSYPIEVLFFHPFRAISEEVFHKAVRHPGKVQLNIDAALFQTLNTPDPDPVQMVTKLHFLAAKADLILLDVAILHQPIGHEIIRNAKVDVEIWGIGTRYQNNEIAPAYLNGILFPKTIADFEKLILNNTKQ